MKVQINTGVTINVKGDGLCHKRCEYLARGFCQLFRDKLFVKLGKITYGNYGGKYEPVTETARCERCLKAETP